MTVVKANFLNMKYLFDVYRIRVEDCPPEDRKCITSGYPLSRTGGNKGNSGIKAKAVETRGDSEVGDKRGP